MNGNSYLTNQLEFFENMTIKIVEGEQRDVDFHKAFDKILQRGCSTMSMHIECGLREL